MQIHLCKPGGEREGPYTLEQIKQDLAAKKYSDTDYWAWHESLPDWVPLYALPGIAATDDVIPPESEKCATPAVTQTAAQATATVTASPVREAARRQERPAEVPHVLLPAASTETGSGPVEPGPTVQMPVTAAVVAAAGLATPPVAPAAEPKAQPRAARAQVSSGMPASALEQVFMFTTGDGPSAWQSPTVSRMLQEIVGVDMAVLREDVERDVVAHCAVDELLKPDGSISDSVWRAMAAHRPELIQQARERLYRVCVRTFRIEADAIVALVLFYNKQKL